MYITIATATINLMVAVAIILLNLYVAVSTGCRIPTFSCFVRILTLYSLSYTSLFQKIKVLDIFSPFCLHIPKL